MGWLASSSPPPGSPDRAVRWQVLLKPLKIGFDQHHADRILGNLYWAALENFPNGPQGEGTCH